MGVGWYSREEWNKLIAVAADRDRLDDTYERWEQNAQRALTNLRAEGVTAKQVAVEVDGLVAWCKERGLQVNGEARARFIAELVQRESN